ncbi:MAG: HIT family protein [Candidatus Moraniibacteriota bacterium]|nr:MAG: HIT family protein [Candidatus Moranbacteria bacterium]
MVCDFCSQDVIAKQEIFRTKFFRVLYPRNPIIPRHFLIIPIRHLQYSFELNNNESKDLTHIQNSIFKKLQSKENCCGYNFSTNNGEKAGQEIKHCHFHIFARFKNEERSPFMLMGKNRDKKFSSKNFDKNISDLRSMFQSDHIL